MEEPVNNKKIYEKPVIIPILRKNCWTSSDQHKLQVLPMVSIWDGVLVKAILTAN